MKLIFPFFLFSFLCLCVGCGEAETGAVANDDEVAAYVAEHGSEQGLRPSPPIADE